MHSYTVKIHKLIKRYLDAKLRKLSKFYWRRSPAFAKGSCTYYVITDRGGHIGPKSLILAPQDIPDISGYQLGYPDISGYQLGFGRRFVKAYNTENPVTNQKIL